MKYLHLQDKVIRLLDILEQNAVISPVDKDEQSKRKHIQKPVIILAKEESLKTVLDLNSLIYGSECN